ncbi:MAG: c-type cytochrome [Novosphingobium sp.]
MTPKTTLLGFSAAALMALAPGLSLAAPAPTVAAAPTAAAAIDGATVFRMRCQSCHSVAPGGASPVGPNLAGVVGRRAAATTFRYSDALTKSGLIWSRPNLDRFLSGPMQMVPGTRMVIKVNNPAERAAIIAYLAGRR